MLPTSLIHCIISGAQSKYRGPHVSCCKKCNKMCRTHIIYFSIKFIFRWIYAVWRWLYFVPVGIYLCCNLFDDDVKLPNLTSLLFGGGVKRTNHCKRTQKKSLMIEMMTGYGAWCHTNVCGLVRHTGRLRYLCISAEGFFG